MCRDLFKTKSFANNSKLAMLLPDIIMFKQILMYNVFIKREMLGSLILTHSYKLVSVSEVINVLVCLPLLYFCSFMLFKML